MEHIVNCDQDMIDVFINSKIEFFREKKCRFIQLESDIDQNHIMYQYFSTKYTVKSVRRYMAISDGEHLYLFYSIQC